MPPRIPAEPVAEYESKVSPNEEIEPFGTLIGTPGTLVSYPTHLDRLGEPPAATG